MKMTFDDIKRDIGWLQSNLSTRDTKYRRNFNRYCNNGRRSEDVWNPYGQPLSFYFAMTEEDTGIIPVINIIKSAVDTHISKLSQTKVRPYFNTVNGSFRARKVVRNAQMFFDEMYNSQDVYKKGIEAARDAEVFEVGHLWINDETKAVERIRPWEFFYDRAEFQNNKLTRCFLWFRNYPLHYLEDKIKGTMYADRLRTLQDTCSYFIYYDLKNKRKYEIVNETLIKESKLTFDVCPVATLFYNPPIKGGYSTSLADDIYSLQTEVDMLSHRIHTAATLNPANTIFIPKGSDVKSSTFNNEIGNMYEFVPAPGVTQPVVISTPAPISPQYQQLLEYYEQKAYNLAGISQLSAQSKKPSGLNSGVALQTLEDVESERHNVILQNYIHFLMQVANICIEVAPETDLILPNRVGTARLTWKDVKEQRDNMSIQFAPSSALSKDPKTKMEQIEKMIAMRIIDQSLVATLMEIPDLERAYSLETASLDVCERIIERAIEEDKYDFYETANLQQLFNLVTFYINRLDANDEEPKTMERLVLLLKVVKEKMNQVNAAVVANMQSPAPATTPAPAPAAEMPQA